MTDKVTVEPYQVCTIPTKLDERVQKGTAVLKLQEKMENGLILLPGLLAVRSREGRMYVDVPVHNDSKTVKSKYFCWYFIHLSKICQELNVTCFLF